MPTTNNPDVSVVVGSSPITPVIVQPGNSVAPVKVTEGGRAGPPGVKGDPGEKGEPGEPGGLIISRMAAIPLSGHRVVLLDGNGKANYVTNAVLSHATRLVGLTTHAADADAPVAIAMYGEVTEPSWQWAADLPIYLGADGNLTQTPPTFPSAKFSIVVGTPITPTSMFIHIGIPITLI